MRGNCTQIAPQRKTANSVHKHPVCMLHAGHMHVCMHAPYMPGKTDTREHRYTLDAHSCTTCTLMHTMHNTHNIRHEQVGHLPRMKARAYYGTHWMHASCTQTPAHTNTRASTCTHTHTYTRAHMQNSAWKQEGKIYGRSSTRCVGDASEWTHYNHMTNTIIVPSWLQSTKPFDDAHAQEDAYARSSKHGSNYALHANVFGWMQVNVCLPGSSRLTLTSNLAHWPTVWSVKTMPDFGRRKPIMTTVPFLPLMRSLTTSKVCRSTSAPSTSAMISPTKIPLPLEKEKENVPIIITMCNFFSRAKAVLFHTIHTYITRVHIFMPSCIHTHTHTHTHTQRARPS
jgi:hypothetical protein